MTTSTRDRMPAAITKLIKLLQDDAAPVKKLAEGSGLSDEAVYRYLHHFRYAGLIVVVEWHRATMGPWVPYFEWKTEHTRQKDAPRPKALSGRERWERHEQKALTVLGVRMAKDLTT